MNIALDCKVMKPDGASDEMTAAARRILCNLSHWILLSVLPIHCYFPRALLLLIVEI